MQCLIISCLALLLFICSLSHYFHSAAFSTIWLKAISKWTASNTCFTIEYGWLTFGCLAFFYRVYRRDWPATFLLWLRVLAGRKRLSLLLYIEKQHPYMSLLHVFIQLYFSSLLRSLRHKLWWKYILFQFHYYFHYINNISFFMSLLYSLRRD